MKFKLAHTVLALSITLSFTGCDSIMNKMKSGMKSELTKASTSINDNMQEKLAEVASAQQQQFSEFHHLLVDASSQTALIDQLINDINSLKESLNASISDQLSANLQQQADYLKELLNNSGELGAISAITMALDDLKGALDTETTSEGIETAKDLVEKAQDKAKEIDFDKVVNNAINKIDVYSSILDTLDDQKNAQYLKEKLSFIKDQLKKTESIDLACVVDKQLQKIGEDLDTLDPATVAERLKEFTDEVTTAIQELKGTSLESKLESGAAKLKEIVNSIDPAEYADFNVISNINSAIDELITKIKEAGDDNKVASYVSGKIQMLETEINKLKGTSAGDKLTDLLNEIKSYVVDYCDKAHSECQEGGAVVAQDPKVQKDPSKPCPEDIVALTPSNANFIETAALNGKTYSVKATKIANRPTDNSTVVMERTELQLTQHTPSAVTGFPELEVEVIDIFPKQQYLRLAVRLQCGPSRLYSKPETNDVTKDLRRLNKLKEIAKNRLGSSFQTFDSQFSTLEWVLNNQQYSSKQLTEYRETTNQATTAIETMRPVFVEKYLKRALEKMVFSLTEFSNETGKSNPTQAPVAATTR